MRFQLQLLALALIPIAVCLFYIYYRDRYQKEPKKLILLLFFLGCLTCIPVIFFEMLLDMNAAGKNIFYMYITVFIGVGIIEEGFKYIAFLLGIWRNRYFNEHFDGIVYAVSVSLGFAAVENVLYVMDSGFETAMLRALTSIPAHTVFGIIMGYYAGLAKFSDGKKRRNYLILSLFIPALLHSAYDTLIMAGESTTPLVSVLFIPFFISIVIMSFKLITKLSNLDFGVYEFLPQNLKPEYYAGFFRRLAAFVIDAFIVGFSTYVTLLILNNSIDFFNSPGYIQFIYLFAAITPCWLYFTLMESSSYYGTLGKLATKIVIIDYKCKRLTFSKANARFWSKLLSTALVLIGYVISLFTKRKQALHDIFASTLVVRRSVKCPD